MPTIIFSTDLADAGRGIVGNDPGEVLDVGRRMGRGKAATKVGARDFSPFHPLFFSFPLAPRSLARSPRHSLSSSPAATQNYKLKVARFISKTMIKCDLKLMLKTKNIGYLR